MTTNFNFVSDVRISCAYGVNDRCLIVILQDEERKYCDLYPEYCHAVVGEKRDYQSVSARLTVAFV